METKELMGVHTPKQTTEFINKLKEYHFDVEDWSWGNDTCDSLRFERIATIYLPSDEWNHYCYLPWKTTWIDDDGAKIVDRYDYDNQQLFEGYISIIDFLLAGQRAKNIEYLQNDFCLKELWNEDEFDNIPNLSNEHLVELVNERKDFYNEQ